MIGSSNSDSTNPQSNAAGKQDDASKADDIVDILSEFTPRPDAADSDAEFPVIVLRPDARTVIAEACLRAALPIALRRRLRRGGAAVVVTVPGADWVTPTDGALKRLAGDVFTIARDGNNRSGHKPEKGGAEIANALSNGRNVVGISQTPSRYLPSALLTVADAHVAVRAPSGALLRRIISEVTGKRVRGAVNFDVAGLSFDEISAAFRNDIGPSDVLRNLSASVQAKSRVSATDDTPTLHDLPGYDGPPREWALRLVEDMSAWRAGRIRWRDVSASAVLCGPPGTGKTLFARSLARTLRLPITVTSCGEWFNSSEGHLGDVIQAAQRAFDAARAVAPSVLFIDELDGIPSRDRLSSRGRDWWQPVVNFVLTLLDGAVTARDGVIVVGATNHPEQLDPALIRPGRLDRLLPVLPPGPDVLAGVMRHHLRDALPDADLVPVARLAAPGSTPADAAGWIREALGAARAASRDLTIDDVVSALAPPDDRPADLLRRIAVHEAGHAIACIAVGQRLDSLTLIRRGAVAGGTFVEATPHGLGRRADLDVEIVGLLAGRAAEQVLLGAISAAAVADLANATRLLAAAHGAMGLGDSLLHHGDPVAQLQFDRDLRTVVEADLQRLYAKAVALIRRRRPAVETVADELVVRRFLTGDDIAALVSPRRRASAPRVRGRNP